MARHAKPVGVAGTASRLDRMDTAPMAVDILRCHYCGGGLRAIDEGYVDRLTGGESCPGRRPFALNQRHALVADPQLPRPVLVVLVAIATTICALLLGASDLL